MVGTSDLLGAALSLRVTADTTGLAADLSSKLTQAERVAITSAERTSAAVGGIADNTSRKLQAATLRQTAAQESYNRLLREGETDTVRLARAQASLITSQQAVAREQTRINAAATPRRGITPLGALGGVAAFAAFTTASRTLRTGVQEIKEAQTGLAQAEAGIRSTGGAANVTADDIERLGKEIQAYSGYTDDSVVAAEDLLLTFPKVRDEIGQGNDIFTRATVAGADLARRGFGDLSTNAKALGKALSDPIAGLTALRRSGITFTDAQRNTIKGLVESNQLLEAQRIILNEVNREVGGSAEAYGMTLPGKLDRAHRSFEDLSESLVTTLEPAISGAADAATFLGEHEGFVKFGLGAAGVAGGFVLVTKAVTSYRNVVDTLFSGGRTASRVAQNTAVAESYNLVAGAAGRAAVAETAAATAGGGIGARTAAEMAALRSTVGRRGFPTLGRGAGIGIGLGAVVAGQAASALIPGQAGNIAGNVLTGAGTGAAIGSIIPGVGTVIGAGVGAVVGAATSIGSGNQPIDPNSLAAIASTDAGRTRLRAISKQLRSVPNGVGNKQADAIDQAIRDGEAGSKAQTAAVAKQQEQQSNQGGLAYASGLDLFSAPVAPRAGRADAVDALTRARASQTTAQNQAELAERRLNALRRDGKATALQLASAEESLRTAKERSAAASQSVSDAEKAVDDTRLPTARDLLKTTRANRRQSDADVKAEARLYAAGLGKGVVAEIIEKNADDPGTLARVARTMTPKLAAALNDEFRRLRNDGSILAGTPDQWEKQGRQRAVDFYNGFQSKWNTFEITTPGLAGQRRRQGRAGRTGAYRLDANDTRRRQRQLSGAPSDPYVPAGAERTT